MSAVLTVSGLTLEVPRRTLFSDLSFSIHKGKYTSVIGPSGIGKTTCLNAIAGLTRPSAGRVQISGKDVWGESASARAKLRLRHVGIVFQFGELLPELTVAQNVMLPLVLQGTGTKECRSRALAELEAVSMRDAGDQYPDDLSGGEVQRVAIARALVHRPDLVLADEPTGALDRTNADVAIRLLIDHARSANAALLVATHSAAVAGLADDTLELDAPVHEEAESHAGVP